MKIYAVAAAILILHLSSCFDKPSETDKLLGTDLPSFRLFLADSSGYFNTKDIPSGKPIALFLLGPQCPYSKAQMKDIIDNLEELKNIQIYALSPFPYMEMRQFYNTYRLNKYTNIKTCIDQENFFAPYIQANVVPCIAIYDSQKKLVKIFTGIISSTEIKNVAERKF
jgi:thiol-disulfide isomerase/thioredoxin